MLLGQGFKEMPPAGTLANRLTALNQLTVFELGRELTAGDILCPES